MKPQYESVKKIIDDAATEIGITVSIVNVFSSSDKNTKQLARFLSSTAESLLLRFPWRSQLGDDPWVLDNQGNYKHVLESDDDIPLIDSRVLKLGTRWRYLHAKGLTYDEDFRAFENRISALAFEVNEGYTVNLNQHAVER